MRSTARLAQMMIINSVLDKPETEECDDEERCQARTDDDN